jgi:hypothetical protein
VVRDPDPVGAHRTGFACGNGVAMGLRVGSWRSGSAMSHAGSGTEEELVGTLNPYFG